MSTKSDRDEKESINTSNEKLSRAKDGPRSIVHKDYGYFGRIIIEFIDNDEEFLGSELAITAKQKIDDVY